MPHKKNLTAPGVAVSVQFVERGIYLIRDHKVMIDIDLAALYGVSTRVLNQQVQRNLKRFPEDFMFQLTKDETEALRSQIVISKPGRGGRRYQPANQSDLRRATSGRRVQPFGSQSATQMSAKKFEITFCDLKTLDVGAKLEVAICKLKSLLRLPLFELTLDEQLSKIRDDFPRDLADDFV